MGIKEWVIGILSIGIFTFMLISTGMYIGNNNDSSNSIMNESSINQTYNTLYGSFDDNLNSFNDSKNRFEDDNPLSLGGDSVFLTSIISTGKTATNVTFGTIIIISTLIEHQLGIPKIILSVIFAIILIVTVLLIWSLIKTGS